MEHLSRQAVRKNETMTLDRHVMEGALIVLGAVG